MFPEENVNLCSRGTELALQAYMVVHVRYLPRSCPEMRRSKLSVSGERKEKHRLAEYFTRLEESFWLYISRLEERINLK